MTTAEGLATWHGRPSRAFAQGAIAPLVDQLREVRLNATADAESVTDSAPSGRVVHVGTNEEWYDMLLAASDGGKLTVVDFGASWCAGAASRGVGLRQPDV